MDYQAINQRAKWAAGYIVTDAPFIVGDHLNGFDRATWIDMRWYNQVVSLGFVSHC